MNVLIDALKIVGMVVLYGLILVIGLYVTIVLGYFLGCVLVLLPWISGVLTAVVPASIIPNVTAWLAVVALFIGVSKYVRRGDE